MSNIKQDFEVFKPHISIQWAKDAVIKTEVRRNSNGRFVCYIKVNFDEFFTLPGTHPTEMDAQVTLDCYVEENSYKE